MERQPRKGDVTPKQVANMVDKYLCDNNFVQTRSAFRREAALFFSSSTFHEIPKGLMSLEAILNQFTILKQEMGRLEREKFKLDKFLQSAQLSINAYNARTTLTPLPSLINSSVTGPSIVHPAVTSPDFVAPQPNPPCLSSIGCTMNQVVVVPPVTPLSTPICLENSSIPAVNFPETRKRIIDVEGTSTVKKTRRGRCPLPTRTPKVKGTHNGSSIFGSSANNEKYTAAAAGATDAGSFNNQPLRTHFAPVSSSCPIAPHQGENMTVSSFGVLPNHHCSNNNISTTQDVTRVNGTVVTPPVMAALSEGEFVRRRLDFDRPDAAISMENETEKVANISYPAMDASPWVPTSATDTNLVVSDSANYANLSVPEAANITTDPNLLVPDCSKDANITEPGAPIPDFDPFAEFWNCPDVSPSFDELGVIVQQQFRKQVLHDQTTLPNQASC